MNRYQVSLASGHKTLRYGPGGSVHRILKASTENFKDFNLDTNDHPRQLVNSFRPHA